MTAEQKACRDMISPPDLGFAASRGFHFTFANPITLALENGDVGMMGEMVEQGGDGSGVGENLIPLLEDLIHRNEKRVALIAAVDDIVEKSVA
jgi:hypothetical protein